MEPTKRNSSDDEKGIDINLMNEEPVPTRRQNGVITRQLFAASTPIVGAACIGMSNGFTATLVPQISNIADIEHGSWLAGTVVLAVLFGNLLSGFTMRMVGRKLTMVFSYVPCAIGWLYISFAVDFSTLLVGSLLIGFGTGINAGVGIVYYAETCEPKVRGVLLGLLVGSVSVGVLLVHALGITLDWRISLRVAAAVPTFGLLLALFVPESPTWLLSRGRTKEASDTFFWLRGRDSATVAEFGSLLQRHQRENAAKSSGRHPLRGLASKRFFRPLFVLVLLFTVQQFTGLNVIIFHAIIVLQKTSAHVDAAACTILIDCLRTVSSVVACYLLRILRRRVLFCVSTACTFLSMVALIVASKYELHVAVLMVALSCYICAMHSGLVAMPWLMNSELYPLEIRDAAISITAVYPFLLQFFMVKTSPSMISTLGVPTTMTIYAHVVLVGAIILYFVLPETKGKTLQETGDKFCEKVNR